MATEVRAGTVVFDIRASVRRFSPAMKAAKARVDQLTASVVALQAALASPALGGIGGAAQASAVATQAAEKQSRATREQAKATQSVTRANTQAVKVSRDMTRAKTSEATSINRVARETANATRAVKTHTAAVQENAKTAERAIRTRGRVLIPAGGLGEPATIISGRGQRPPRTDRSASAARSAGRDTRRVVNVPGPGPATTTTGFQLFARRTRALEEEALLRRQIAEEEARNRALARPLARVERIGNLIRARVQSEQNAGLRSQRFPESRASTISSGRVFGEAAAAPAVDLGAGRHSALARAFAQAGFTRDEAAVLTRALRSGGFGTRRRRLDLGDISRGLDPDGEPLRDLLDRESARFREFQRGPAEATTLRTGVVRPPGDYSRRLRGTVGGRFTELPAGYRFGVGGPQAQGVAVREALGRRVTAGARPGGRFAFGGPLARSVAGFGVPPGAVGGASLLAGGFIGITAITAATGALIAYGAAWRQVQEVAGGARTSLSGLVDLVSGINTALRDSIGPLANYVASNVTLTDALTRFQDTARGLGTDSSLRTFVDRGATRLGNAINAINDNPEALSTGIQLAGRATNAAVGGFTANIIARPIAVGVGLVARALAILPGPLGLFGRGLALVAEIMPSFATGFGVLAGLFPNFRRRFFEFIGAFTTGATFDAIKGFVSGIGDLANSIGGFLASIGITPENIALAFNGILKVLQFTAGALGGALDALATGVRNLRDFFSSLPSRLTNFVARVLRGSPEGNRVSENRVSELGLFGEVPADNSPRTGPTLAQLDALESRLPIVESFASELDAGAASVYGMVSVQHEANQRMDEYRAVRKAANQAEADAIAALRRRIDLEARASEQSIEGVSAEARRERPSFNFQQDDDIRAFIQRPPPRLVREDDREAQRRRQLTEDLQLANNAIDAITGRLDLIPSTDLEARLPLEQQRSQLFARRDTTLESLGIFDEEAASKLADQRNKENERILREDLRRREREAAETQKAFEDLWITPMENSFSSFFHDSITGVHSLSDAFDNLVQSILSTLVNNAIAQPAATALSELFRAGVTALRGGPETGQSELDIGARHLGGPVTAGRRYLVGEAGPELFQPSQSGEIVSNAELRGGGGTTVINNWYSNDTTAARATVEEMTPAILGLARRQSLADQNQLRTT